MGDRHFRKETRMRVVSEMLDLACAPRFSGVDDPLVIAARQTANAVARGAA
jgi:hypothetical protein